MKTRKEFRKIKHIIRVLESNQYPGYPYCSFGVIDFKTKDCWTSNGRKNFIVDKNWYKFASQFEAGMLYHTLDSRFDQKGSFVFESHMDNYKKFLTEPWQTSRDDDDDLIENFYIDNQELVRLYFAVYAAIREYKNTNKIMLYIYDGDAEYVDVLLFDTLDEINKYYKDYVKGE